MGKNKCCKKSSTLKCDESSSSCSSSTYGSCCPKYPKCCCVKDVCAPIYYPNNYVSQYPCNPCKPQCPPLCPPRCPPLCPPYPCPPYPCPPSQCAPTYTSYSSILAGSLISFNLLSNYTLFIVNPTDVSGNLFLPSITSLSSCSYNKMFVISNISTQTIILNPSSTTTTTDNINGQSSVIIAPNSSVNVYSSYISGVGYWSLVQTGSFPV
jgi:hypothetical protein